MDGLAAAGAEVTAVEAYRTVPAAAERLAPLAAWIERELASMPSVGKTIR